MFDNVNVYQVMRWAEIIGQQLFLFALYAVIFAMIIILPKYIYMIIYYIISRIVLYIDLLATCKKNGRKIKILRLPFLSAFFAAPDITIDDGKRKLRITLLDVVYSGRTAVTIKSDSLAIYTRISSRTVRQAVRNGETYILSGSDILESAEDRRKKINLPKAKRDCTDIVLISPKPLAVCYTEGSRINACYEPIKFDKCIFMTSRMLKQMIQYGQGYNLT